jgi:hypothetical protein
MRRSLSSNDSRNTLIDISLGMLPVGDPLVRGIVMKGTNNEMPQQHPPSAGEYWTMTGATTEPPGLETVCETSHETTGWLDRIERIESVIKRYPWPTLLLALGVGYAISRRILR